MDQSARLCPNIKDGFTANYWPECLFRTGRAQTLTRYRIYPLDVKTLGSEQFLMEGGLESVPCASSSGPSLSQAYARYGERGLDGEWYGWAPVSISLRSCNPGPGDEIAPKGCVKKEKEECEFKDCHAQL
eukprot:1777620-Amphidinium_carterae.1